MQALIDKVPALIVARPSYEWLAIAVLALHLLWILWVIFGFLVTRQRQVLTGLHIISLLYGIGIYVGNWYCPLTLLEQHFQRQAGIEPYSGGFLIHYLETLVYPDVPPALLTTCAIAVCVANLSVYVARYRSVTKGRCSEPSQVETPL
jgi:hypothetical protein